MNSKYKFGYEDSDKKIIVDIYGLEFEIKEITKDDILKIQEDKEDVEKINIYIEKLLGNGSIEKINKKRIEDGHEEMNLTIKVGLLAFVVQTYFKEMTNQVNNMYNSFDNVQKININRRNNKYNRNYRRY